MKFKFKKSAFFCRMLLAIVLGLLGVLTAEAQCNVEQTAKLLADDGAAGDWFGFSVAISGNTAIVGACYHDDDDNGYRSGSAYLFDMTTGQQITKLLPDDAAPTYAHFGYSVAISGTTVIVSAIEDDDNGYHSGSAYLFDTTTGQQIFKLLPLDGAPSDHFGTTVSISGTTAIVGSRSDDENGHRSGSAYLFDTTTGQQIAKLLPIDGAAEDRFGSVAISGNTAVIGAYGDDDNGLSSGSAYIFDTTTGEQIFKLLPDDGAADDWFGYDVAIDGSTVIVGALFDDDNGYRSGSAYLFDIASGLQIAKLLPIDGAAEDHFGLRVAISGNTAVVGAAISGGAYYSGSAYLFDITSGQQIAKLLPNDGTAGDTFGIGVAIDGTTAIVGARDDYNEELPGSAYLFDVSNVNCEDVVHASQYTVYRGFQISGDLTNSFESDDSYLRFNPAMTINSSEAPVWLIFDGTLPSDKKLVSLEIVMESNAGTPGLTHTLEAWNWTSAAYDVLDVATASFNDDVVVTVDLSSGISEYAQAGTGAVRTRVGWRKTGLIINYPWEVRLDQMVWIIQ